MGSSVHLFGMLSFETLPALSRAFTAKQIVLPWGSPEKVTLALVPVTPCRPLTGWNAESVPEVASADRKNTSKFLTPLPPVSVADQPTCTVLEVWNGFVGAFIVALGAVTSSNLALTFLLAVPTF